MTGSIETYPVTSFVKRITLASGGTAFIDGFNMIVASVALTLMSDVFNPVEVGLYASLYVLGVFLAALLGGKIGDRVGRTVIYKAVPLCIIVISVLMLFWHTAFALLLGRFLMGIFVGADYPMANTIVSEWSPGSWRSKSLVILMMAWYVGALVGSVVGYCMYGVGEQWPWLLFTPAVPALIFFLLRLSVPESPRWLVAQTKTTDADRVLKKVFGASADVKDLGAVQEESGEQVPRTSLIQAFKMGYFKRFFFVTVFWVCQCAPVTVVFMFGPTILQTFGLGSGALSVLGTALIYVFFMLGVAPAIKCINGMPRRTTVIVTYAFMAAALLLLGLFSNASPIVVLVLFAIYALPYGLQSVLDNVYPPELFPTEVRSTAIGFLTAISKLGGAVASFLFPMGLEGFGLGSMFIVGGVISIIGLVVSIFMAPETKGLSLEESSSL